MINLKHFESSLWKIDTKSYKNTGYITIKNIDDYQSIYSVVYTVFTGQSCKRIYQRKKMEINI